MPHKKKRLFTKHNSTKFVLFTEGRDADGNKITENVLVPVSHNHVPGSSLLIQKVAGVCSQQTDDSVQTKSFNKTNTERNIRQKNESLSEKEANLEDILNQMDNVSDSDEEYETVKAKLKNFNFFDDLQSSKYDNSKIQVQVEESSDLSDEFEMGQFSDAESENSDFREHKSKPKMSKIASSKTEDCPENIKLLNDCFEKIYEEYDDDQIGALDDEEICGAFSPEDQQISHFMNTPFQKVDTEIEIGNFDKELKERILKYSEIDHPEKIVEVIIEKPIEFDCESILSTYSNIYNHPTVIKEEPKQKSQHSLIQCKLTKSRLKQLEPKSDSDTESDLESRETTFNCRAKGETREEKRERKHLFKEAKRECRKLKKENKLAFKNEKKVLVKQEINTRKNNVLKLL